MGDVFKEQMIKKAPSRKDTLIKAALIAAAFLLAAAAMLFLPTFMPIVAIAAVFGVYYAFSMLNKEFEYIFTSGELDIDCIYGKSRRKRKFSCDIKEAILMTHASNGDGDNEFSASKETIDCSERGVGPDTYYLLAIYQNKRVKVIFDPNEKMLAAISPYMGRRKLIHKKGA
jgi:hypothetical protein